jgi:formylglycine-generating enzyme
MQRRVGGYRLPTEAEWEYACRAGTMTAYSYGDSLSKSDANYDSSNTNSVGSYKSNAFGLYDMHGNVWEWCEDRWEGYPVGPITDPKGAATGDAVMRGGTFDGTTSNARSSNRNYYAPAVRLVNVGFRLARTP